MPGSEDRIDSVANSGKIIPELDRIYEAMSRVASLIITINDLGKNMGFGKGFKEAFDAMKQAQSGLQELNKAKADALKAESELRQSLLDSKRANQDLKNQIEALRLEEAKRREEARKAKEAINAEKGSIVALRAELKKLQGQWDSYGAASRNANQGTLKRIQDISTELKKLEGQTGRFQRNVGNYPQLVGGISGLLGSFGVTVGTGAIAKEVFDTTVQLDSLNAALKVVSGSEREYAKNQEFLVETSDRLGLNILDLTKAYKLFFAASTQSGLSADETRKIFNSVAETAANLKLSQEDANGVLLAFSQILGKGKVQAEELRGQIGERVPGAFSIAARSIGVTEQQLNKMLEKGEVVAAEFLPKFAAELEKTFGIDNEARVRGLQASVNRLHDTLVALVENNESNLNGFFTVMIQMAIAGTKALDGLITKIQDVGHGISQYLDRSTVGRGLNNVLDPFGIFDTNEAVDKSLASDKNRQERINKALDALSNKSAKDQVRLIALLNDRAKVARDQAIQAKKTYGEASKEFVAAVAAQGYLEDLALAAQQQLDQVGKRPTPTAGKGPTEKELNAAARLKESQLKAALDARKIELQDAIESQKEIFENEKVAYEDRLVAAETYYTLKNILAKESADGEKKIIDVEISRGRATAAEKVTVDKKAAAEQAQNRRELGKIVTDILKDNADKETKEIISAGEKRQAEIERQRQEELAAAQKLYKDGKINLDQYELERLRIENKYQILSLQAEYDYTEQVIRLMQLRGEDTSKQENQLLDIRNKIRDLDLDYFDKAEKKKTEIAKEETQKRKKFEEEYANRVKDLRQELGNAVSAIVDGIFERQKNRLQDEIDLISQRQEAEIAAVQASSASEEEKAQKIAVINAQADAQKQALERRQRQFDQQKARFDRAKSVVEIIANTGIGVAKAFADYPYFLAAPLAAVIGAIGAAQLATVLAQPIPKYKDGTDDHPGGLAMVNDGGQLEVLEAPDGTAFVPQGRNVIMDIPAHYKVHPSIDDYLAAAGASTMRGLPAIDGTSQSVDRLIATVRDENRKQTDRLLDGLEKHKTTVNVNNTHLGVKASATKAQQRIEFVNKEFRY
jgi:tape measure domain-containing protein